MRDVDEERLRMIALRCEAATPGPWTRVAYAGVEHVCGRCAPYAHYESIAVVGQEDDDEGAIVSVGRVQDDAVLDMRIADAVFIANARADVAFLLRTIEYLTVAQSQSKRDNGGSHDG